MKKMNLCRLCVFLVLGLSCSVVIGLYISFAKSNTHVGDPWSEEQAEDECEGRYIYIHKVPAKFNVDLLKNCESLNPFTEDMCKQLENEGLGWNMLKGWYSTNQFSLEVIFHNRMKRYKCLTKESSSASAIYVPFYAGLDVGRFLWDANVTRRDGLSVEFAEWVRSEAEWGAMQGRNHFMVAGRITWDFRREKGSEWGNRLLLLPELSNMTALVLESGKGHANEISIPYPTCFHPSTQAQLSQWQRTILTHNRPYLFSFAGSPRPQMNHSIRSHLIHQCIRSSPKCNLLRCDQRSCDRPSTLMTLFLTSVFCLQPPGDSYTRRSTFDSILAACIPVFFHPDSAYNQYSWHLPGDHAAYSVFISMDDIKTRNLSIQSELSRIPTHRVHAMRQHLLTLVPALIYANPMADQPHLASQDAFDITVNQILNRIKLIPSSNPL